MRAFFVFRPHWRRLITQPSGACAEAAIFGRWTVPSTGLVVIAPAAEAIRLTLLSEKIYIVDVVNPPVRRGITGSPRK